MESYFQHKRKFYPMGFALEYGTSCKLPAELAGEFVHACVHGLLPVEALNAKPLRDLKGREPQELIIQAYPPAMRPRAEEIAFVAGQIFVEPQSDSEPSELPFDLRLHAEFSEFEGAHHILHTPRETRSQSLPEFLTLANIGCAFPLQITAFRFALEIFRSKFMSAWFGFSPVVTQGLLIDCWNSEVHIRVFADSLKNREELPLQRHRMLEKLGQLSQRFFERDLAADLTARVLGGH